MTQVLGGLNGANPVGFLAAVGLLRLASSTESAARLSFLADGTFRAVLSGFGGDVAELVAQDAALAEHRRTWWLTYDKTEKKGVKKVADLKAPPRVFAEYMAACVNAWIAGDAEAAAYAAAFGTSVAVDGKGNTKPTAFHFTAANQQFLDTAEKVRATVSAEWANRSLFEGGAYESGQNLRWDPSAERNWALMAGDPTSDGTRVDAPLEWLAFRGLPLFPSFPARSRSRIATTAVAGRGSEMKMTWPLWSVAASLAAVRSILSTSWAHPIGNEIHRGVFAVCESDIRRTSQGFGNFGPAAVRT